MGDAVNGPGTRDNGPPLSLPERAEDLTPEHVKQALMHTAIYAEDATVRLEALIACARILGMLKDVRIHRYELGNSA
jgi:hypothetical protein